jgi:hypothetical protein
MKIKALDIGLSPLPVLTRDTAPNPARLRRETLPLDGTWSLRVNGGDLQPVQVPFPPQAKINGIHVPEGEVRLHYALVFELPSDWTGGLLHLEGVDHEAEVLVNGTSLARHTGAWDPIGVFVPGDVLAKGVPGDHGVTLHTIEVAVRDNSRARTILSGKQERDTKEGVIFYANMSGLWKSVWIERVEATRLHDFYTVAEASGRLCVTVEVAGPHEGHEVVLRLAHEDGGDIELRGHVLGGRVTLAGRVPDVRPWSTETRISTSARSRSSTPPAASWTSCRPMRASATSSCATATTA